MRREFFEMLEAGSAGLKPLGRKTLPAMAASVV
jgi:hypothetical protein